jgi:SAM-dependent methyltransferase
MHARQFVDQADMLWELIRHPFLATRFILRRIREIPSKGLPGLRRPQSDDFDRKYGVETSKLVQIAATKSPNVGHGNRYQASGEAVIRWCIENCGMPHEETTFVDVGCGKGRVLIVAAMYPFKRIIGVEYSTELAKACRKNLEKLRIIDKCEIVVGDAADFTFPDGALFAFLYNPFDSVILERVLKNLASTQGCVRIGQLGLDDDVILHSGVARAISSGEGAKIYEVSSTLRQYGE